MELDVVLTIFSLTNPEPPYDGKFPSLIDVSRYWSCMPDHTTDIDINA